MLPKTLALRIPLALIRWVFRCRIILHRSVMRMRTELRTRKIVPRVMSTLIATLRWDPRIRRTVLLLCMLRNRDRNCRVVYTKRRTRPCLTLLEDVRWRRQKIETVSDRPLLRELQKKRRWPVVPWNLVERPSSH